MYFIRPRKSVVLLAVLVILGIGTFTFFFGPIDPIPRIRASAKSPDGALVANVYKKRLSLLPTARVGILVQISNAKDEVLYERIIFEDGWWHYDIADMYTQIIFAQDEVRIGPGFTPDDYFAIKKSMLIANQR